MVYLAEWDPEQDFGPGPSPSQVALGEVGLLHYMTSFASTFFKNGAMPVTLVGLEKPISETERDRTERKLARLISGIGNAFRVKILNSGFTPITLTPPLDALAMPELDERARQAIATAFGIPQTMLEDAANRATAEGHRMSFWQDTVRPHGEWVEDELNRQLFHPLGLHLEFAFDEMDIFQEDEAARAESLTKLVEAGTPLDVALQVLGYELTKAQWARVQEEMDKKQSLLETLATQGSQDKETGDAVPKEDPDLDNRAKRVDPNPHPPPDRATLDEAREELVKWQRKSLDALNRGKAPGVVWRSEYIPAGVQNQIHLGLTGALTEEDVRRVFDAGFHWLLYGGG
jgi:hypothetical protein